MFKSKQIFPQTIYKSQYDRDLNVLIQQLYNIKQNTHNNVKDFPEQLMFQTSFSLFKEYSLFNNLYRFIETLIRTHLNNRLKITESWGNIYSKYGYSKFHTHSPHSISGVLYLNTFNNDFLCIHNKFGPEKTNIPVKNGDLIIFNGDQPHSTLPNLTDTNKIIIAFNADIVN